MSRKTLIIIPALNESDSLPKIFEDLSILEEVEFLVVDDASTDNSVALCRERGVTVLPLRVRIGAWAATQAGMRYALRHGYDAVITMDGDGQHHSFDIPKFLETARQHPEIDVIIGECIARGSRLRHIAWSFFRLITRISIDDLTSGFRMYNHKATTLLSSDKASLLDYQDVGVLLMLRAEGMKLMEIPVTTTPRIHGKSHLFSGWLKVVYYMIITTILAVSKLNLSGTRH